MWIINYQQVWQHPFVNLVKFAKNDTRVGIQKKGDVQEVLVLVIVFFNTLKDKDTGKKGFKIVGSIAANNFVSFPASNISLGLTGTFAYVQLQVWQDKKHVFHIDVETRNNSNFRISFSNLYKTTMVQDIFTHVITTQYRNHTMAFPFPQRHSLQAALWIRVGACLPLTFPPFWCNLLFRCNSNASRVPHFAATCCFVTCLLRIWFMRIIRHCHETCFYQWPMVARGVTCMSGYGFQHCQCKTQRSKPCLNALDWKTVCTTFSHCLKNPPLWIKHHHFWAKRVVRQGHQSLHGQQQVHHCWNCNMLLACQQVPVTLYCLAWMPCKRVTTLSCIPVTLWLSNWIWIHVWYCHSNLFFV